jgi:hypothetical protein
VENGLLKTDTAIEVQITMRLNEEDYNRVLSTNQEFPKVAAYLVEQYSKGGVLLRPSQARFIEQLAGTPIRTAEAVLQAFENAHKHGSAAGYLRVTYDVDPAFAEPLEQLAKAQSRTVDEIVQEGMNIVLTNSWLYSISVDGGTLLLTQQAREEMEQLVGEKPLTTTGILRWARALKKMEPKPVKVGKLKAEVREKLELLSAEAMN